MKILSISELRKFISQDKKLILSKEEISNINNSRKVVENIIKKGSTSYGINTGFGKFSETKISNEQIEELQRRIVLSHACGVGNPMPINVVKIMIYLKVKSLTLGFSGVSLAVVETLAEMYNKDVIPYVPEKGSVGASGDLAPLAHMALPLIGEGQCYFNGDLLTSKEAFKKAKIKTLHLQAKDGLAILNGTQCILAFLVSALIEIEDLLDKSEIIAALTLEGLAATSKAFDERIQKVRGQLGQFTVAKNIRKLIKSSHLIDSRNQVQDAYSLRCIPQVHGAVRDTFLHVKMIAEREMNGVTDNPLVFIKENEVLSGGNFHGEPLAFVADFMTIAIAELASISERRIAHLIDPNLSHLPAFLVKEGGLNSGFMMPQYTAAALVSENKVLAHHASVDSIPTSANKEDHVSMGTHAARKLCQVVENTKHVLAIEMLCAAQSIDLQVKKPSPINQKVHKAIRSKISYWNEDRLMKTDLDLAYAVVDKNILLDSIK